MNRRRFLSLAAVPALALIPKLPAPVAARKADILTYPMTGWRLGTSDSWTAVSRFVVYGGGRRVGKTTLERNHLLRQLTA